MKTNENTHTKEKKEFRIKPYSIQELANFYSISYCTMKKWLDKFKDEVGEKMGRYYTVKQVETILAKLGTPKTISLE